MYFFLQAVQSQLYDDYAALYYLLLNKWEQGQLEVSAEIPPVPHQKLNNSSVLPSISINPSDLSRSPVGQPHAQWHHITGGGGCTTGEYPNDPNLLRYLKLGRRHTLGAAQNHMLMRLSDLGHLHETSECSSQTSNESTSNIDCATSSPNQPLTLRSALASGQAEIDSSSLSSSPLRVSGLQPQVRSRMGRRASDGGPYAAVFRLFLEKRMPHLSQINSRGSLYNSSTLSSESSVKQLLQERRPHESQSGKQTAHSKDWLLYKDKVRMFYHKVR